MKPEVDRLQQLARSARRSITRAQTAMRTLTSTVVGTLDSAKVRAPYVTSQPAIKEVVDSGLSLSPLLRFSRRQFTPVRRSPPGF